jgi:hypothetical protein
VLGACYHSGDLFKHDDCYAVLRLCWNVEWFGGLDAVLSGAVDDEAPSDCAQELRLLATDLGSLKAAAVDRRCGQLLCHIQNATTHQAVLQSVNCITGSASVLSQTWDTLSGLKQAGLQMGGTAAYGHRLKLGLPRKGRLSLTCPV